MGDIDSCLDAFKHLPYFKPLYTTILRQQMQYLTEQLSLHAGEESLVLTTNISAGTISSLTSTFGTGFLDHRSELKKQFTQHCAKNKLTYESLKYENRRSIQPDNMYIHEQTNMSIKRKRPEVEKEQHTVKIPNMNGFLKTKDKDKSTHKQTPKANLSSKDQLDTPPHVGDLSNIEIENVRSIQSEEGLGTKTDLGNKESPGEAIVSEEGVEGSTECTYIIKEEPDDVDCFVITKITKDSGVTETANSVDDLDNESNHAQSSDDSDNSTNQPNSTLLKGQISMDTFNNMTDDVISVRESYISDEKAGSLPEKIIPDTVDQMHIVPIQKSNLSSSEECSLPGKISTETDGTDMWIVAGVDSESNLVEMSNTMSTSIENGLTRVSMQTAELSSESGIDKTFEIAINQTFSSSGSTGYLSNMNVSREYQKTVPYKCSQPTSAAQARRSTDDKKSLYKCNYCPQSFTSHSSQVRHERRHTGETPWSCEFCDKRFYRKDDLHVHSLKHVGQKPYMCPICLTGYCKKKLLELHIATHKDQTETDPITQAGD